MRTFRGLAAFTALLLLLSFQTGAYQQIQGDAETAVNFDHTLDDYKPKKNHYNFYFTYKIVNPWWDAVAMGMEDAQQQFLERGITVDYEYMAPTAVDAKDQSDRLHEAMEGDYDVIGVDVADEVIISPLLNAMRDQGHKVMTFSTSDAAPSCRRIAFVGNSHNYEDGALLTEVLCRKLHQRGKVAILVGSKGAPCHEDRARGAKDTIARYPGMEIVAVEYDEDSIEKAEELTEKILEEHQDLDGIICCNMSNPVGAARAVKAAKRDLIIVGMDHDREALQDLRDGVIYCLGVQDCYSMGFDTLQVAVKIADGIAPGTLYPEKTEETTTIIYQRDAEAMLELLFGEMG
jgi:ribose transport system substrate-binding protein